MPVDHCTLFPEGNWGEACCLPHDEAFAAGGSLVDFVVSNIDLGVCVALVSELWPIGLLMAAGTTLFGLPFWIRAAWRRRAQQTPSTNRPASSGLFRARTKEPTMAAENFELIMDQIFRHEGGYVDHPSDPGGATNMGITIGTLRDYRGTAVTKADVRSLTKAEAREIYRKRYWDVVSGDELPSGVDLCTMDSAVNSGPSRGARWLQRAVGADPDGAVGTRTLSAVEGVEPSVIVNRMCDDRMNFLRGLKTWPTFGRGWTRRVEEVRAMALELAKAPVVITAPTPRSDVGNPTAIAPTPEAVHEANAEPWYQSRVTWGAIIAAATPAIALTGYALDAVDREIVVAGLTAAGAVFGAATTLYGRWKAKRPIGARPAGPA